MWWVWQERKTYIKVPVLLDTRLNIKLPIQQDQCYSKKKRMWSIGHSAQQKTECVPTEIESVVIMTSILGNTNWHQPINRKRHKQSDGALNIPWKQEKQSHIWTWCHSILDCNSMNLNFPSIKFHKFTWCWFGIGLVKHEFKFMVSIRCW